MPRRHDADAGGDTELLAAKASLRDEVWDALQAAGVARFPGAHHRIPNFTGAEAAAERLRDTDVWRAARTIKANPDSPQWPVRQRALEDGKTVFMSVPRLAADRPFLRLDADRLRDSPRQAASIRGSSRNAAPVGLDELEPVDLVVTGCVAVTTAGARLGKGGGFADLEFAIASEAGLITPATTVTTTVHEVQVVAHVPTSAHDQRLDLIVTPARTLRVSGAGRRTSGRIRWDELTEDKIAAIPVLQRLRAAGPGG